jgi:peptidyl-dipeptidase Dcp
MRTLAVLTAAGFAMVACSSHSPDPHDPGAAASAQAPAGQASVAKASSSANHANPFFAKSTLPFQAPPFDKIKDADYKPAIEKGMAERLDEVEKIANNANPPTFENTYVALEKTGALLGRVMSTFNAVTSANTDPTLQKVQSEIAP